jgi:acyl-CoA thioester hydrolase
MPRIFHYRHTVTKDEIDGLGHANNVSYVEWMQAAAVAHSAEHGWTNDRYLNMGKGWVARSHRIEYLQPAFQDDRLVIETWVAKMKKVTSVRRYRMRREDDDVLLATAETKWAFVDYNTGQPLRVPQEVIDSFEQVGE